MCGKGKKETDKSQNCKHLLLAPSKRTCKHRQRKQKWRTMPLNLVVRRWDAKEEENLKLFLFAAECWGNIFIECCYKQANIYLFRFGISFSITEKWKFYLFVWGKKNKHQKQIFQWKCKNEGNRMCGVWCLMPMASCEHFNGVLFFLSFHLLLKER